MSPDEVILGVAAWGLPDARFNAPDRPLEPDTWASLQDQVARHRLWGLLGAVVAAGALPATEEQQQQAEARHRLAMQTVLELEALAVTAVEALDREGLDSRLLKGLATAHLDELDPSLRCFSDVDILVHRHDLPEAIELFRHAAYERDLPERRPGFDRRFAKEATLTGPRGREIDLHTTLAVGAFGFAVDLESLWASTDSVALAGSPLAVLDANRRLLHACYGAVLGDPVPRLVLLRDIALILTGDRADVDAVVDLARFWRGESVLAVGITLAAQAFRASAWPLVEWANSLQPSPWERRALGAYRSQGGSNSRVLLSGAMSPMSIRDRGAYLRALLLPGRGYVLARRRAGRPSEARTALRELGRRRPSSGRTRW